MKKQWIALFMVAALLLSALPAGALAAAKQMEDGVPVWTEETVKDYILRYIRGVDLDTLRGYYDLQVRRYMPMDTYETMLTEIEWMTGGFVGFGTYRSFEEPGAKTKTHVLHLGMEKQDLDLYFTHKNKEDDWEVMAVEFVFAPRQDNLVNPLEGMPQWEETAYTETEVTVGSAPYELTGILTLPEGASPDAPVPACVLVHDMGALDRDATIGQTRLFADLAKAFAERGIASLRYDKRTYAYRDSLSPADIAGMTAMEETVQDALFAGELLKNLEAVDETRIVLVGHGLGAMLAPRIAQASEKIFCAQILIGGSPKTLLELAAGQDTAQAGELAGMGEEEARSLTILGMNGYYYWEMAGYDPVKIIQKLRIPTYIVQGSRDTEIPLESGVEAYEDRLGEKLKYVDFKTYRGLNHYLVQYAGDEAFRGTPQEYDVPAALDVMAGRDLASWINDLWATE